MIVHDTLTRNEAFDVVTKVEGCFASRDRSRFYICDTFFKRTPAIRRDFAFTIVCEASAIRSRARYVTIPARVYDYSTGNEVRRYTRGYPREKSIHDPPGPGFRRARLCFSQFEESSFQENDTVEIFRKIFSVYVRTHVQAQLTIPQQTEQLIPIRTNRVYRIYCEVKRCTVRIYELIL